MEILQNLIVGEVFRWGALQEALGDNLKIRQEAPERKNVSFCQPIKYCVTSSRPHKQEWPAGIAMSTLSHLHEARA